MPGEGEAWKVMLPDWQKGMQDTDTQDPGLCVVIGRVGIGCSCLAFSLSALPTELGLVDVGLWYRPWPGYAGSTGQAHAP